MNAEIITIASVIAFTIFCWIKGGFTALAIDMIKGEGQHAPAEKSAANDKG